MKIQRKTLRIAAVIGIGIAAGTVARAQEVSKPEAVPVPPASASAQPSAPAQTLKKTAKVKPGEYRISREDSISITCLNDIQYSITATVLPDGTISYPKMGQIAVAGKTLRELELVITRFLLKEFVRPQISVAVRERQVRQIALTGSGVKSTGKRVMRDGWRVRDAISDAGGLLSDRTDLFTAKLIRDETKEIIPVDLVAAYSDIESEANLILEPNDLLIVDAAEESKSQVLVSGEVMKPGFVIIPRDRTISKALESAGGPKPGARLSEAIIERNGEKITVDLRQLVSVGTEPDQRLQPGDKLVVPENKNVYYLVGAVGRQGATLIPDDRPMTLVRALSDANVPLQNAETKKTQIVRENSDGTQTATIVDVEQILKDADYSKDVKLQPGDIVYVPYKKGRKFGLMDGVSTLGSIAGLRFLFFR
ncbi:MAG: polysaccharide biosynthesis/export family protein [Akkermansiaceae bacterium]|nr:polysaccharide biosynthesis/export family protein [Armatimonadota bacterium]